MEPETPAAERRVSQLPASCVVHALTGPLPRRVMMLTTPPIASAPYSVDCGPRITSMRSISSGDRSERSTWPSVGLFTRMPSTSTCTWLGLAPRIEIEVDLPKLPERRMSTPGTPRSASSTVGYRRVSISSPVITVTEAPSCSAGVSVRVAVTTTGSACLTSCACAVLTMSASTTTAFHDVRGMPGSFFRERVEGFRSGQVS